MREAIGPQRDLLIDVHSLVTLEQSLKLIERLTPLKLFCVEEVTPDPLANLAAIKRAAQVVKMPIAGHDLGSALETLSSAGYARALAGRSGEEATALPMGASPSRRDCYDTDS